VSSNARSTTLTVTAGAVNWFGSGPVQVRQPGVGLSLSPFATAAFQIYLCFLPLDQVHL
jgi:hypothetical protein